MAGKLEKSILGIMEEIYYQRPNFLSAAELFISIFEERGEVTLPGSANMSYFEKKFNSKRSSIQHSLKRNLDKGRVKKYKIGRFAYWALTEAGIKFLDKEIGIGRGIGRGINFIDTIPTVREDNPANIIEEREQYLLATIEGVKRLIREALRLWEADPVQAVVFCKFGGLQRGDPRRKGFKKALKKFFDLTQRDFEEYCQKNEVFLASFEGFLSYPGVDSLLVSVLGSKIKNLMKHDLLFKLLSVFKKTFSCENFARKHLEKISECSPKAHLVNWKDLRNLCRNAGNDYASEVLTQQIQCWESGSFDEIFYFPSTWSKPPNF